MEDHWINTESQTQLEKCALHSYIKVLSLCYTKLHLLKSLFKNNSWQIKHVVNAHHVPIIFIGI